MRDCKRPSTARAASPRHYLIGTGGGQLFGASRLGVGVVVGRGGVGSVAGSAPSACAGARAPPSLDGDDATDDGARYAARPQELGVTDEELGDCATVVRPKSIGKAEDLFREGGSDLERRIGLPELQAMLRRGAEEFSHLEELANRAEEAYGEIVGDRDGLNFEQFKEMLAKTDAGLRSCPATAQVAKQEGEYLADLFNTAAGDREYIGEREDTPAFRYKHKGSLAYIGRDSGVADIPGVAVLKGLVGGLVWKGFETWSQVGWRNRFLVLADMLRAKLFGRDMSRL